MTEFKKGDKVRGINDSYLTGREKLFMDRVYTISRGSKSTSDNTDILVVGFVLVEVKRFTYSSSRFRKVYNLKDKISYLKELIK